VVLSSCFFFSFFFFFFFSFLHDVEWCVEVKNLALKLLLVFDNVPAHLQDFGLVSSNIQVECRPMNTISILRLLDLAVIATFKSYFTHCTLCSIWDAKEDSTFVNASECWRSYSIAHCTVM
jgi:hypothetical protein